MVVVVVVVLAAVFTGNGKNANNVTGIANDAKPPHKRLTDTPPPSWRPLHPSPLLNMQASKHPKHELKNPRAKPLERPSQDDHNHAASTPGEGGGGGEG